MAEMEGIKEYILPWFSHLAGAAVLIGGSAVVLKFFEWIIGWL